MLDPSMTYRDSTNDLGRRADKRTDASNFLVAEAAHGPVLPRAADVDGEVLQQLDAPGGVADFGVGLDAVDGLLLVRDGREGRVARRGDGAEALRELAQAIAVRHVLYGVSWASLTTTTAKDIPPACCPRCPRRGGRRRRRDGQGSGQRGRTRAQCRR